MPTVRQKGLFVITSSVIGAGAGFVLVAIELALGDELHHVESAAVGIAVMGLALTAYDSAKDGQGSINAYWGIAALAGVPAVVAHWARRKAAHARELATHAGAIAERDYRRACPPPSPDDLR
jgi:hypothetical protein